MYFKYSVVAAFFSKLLCLPRQKTSFPNRWCHSLVPWITLESKLNVNTFQILTSSVFKQYNSKQNHQAINYINIFLIWKLSQCESYCLDSGCQDSIRTGWFFVSWNRENNQHLSSFPLNSPTEPVSVWTSPIYLTSVKFRIFSLTDYSRSLRKSFNPSVPALSLSILNSLASALLYTVLPVHIACILTSDTQNS